MSHRKVQKEVDAVFKKIHEGIDLFNYHFTRHENSTNDSQRDKLENDLKKEIKKLQKFRDQIKTWQSNDQIEAIIAPSKLQEHRKLVEEAMECYKEVEKSSKMKSFSNQSIMLAALESGDSDLSEEVIEVIKFLEGVIESLNDQLEEINEEYERISQKKTRKNASSVVEERKQELEHYSSKHHFHIEKIEIIIQYLRNDKLSPESIWLIQDDLNFYVESNQDPDFVDDETLYDEIIKEARQNADRINSEIEQERQKQRDIAAAAAAAAGTELEDDDSSYQQKPKKSPTTSSLSSPSPPTSSNNNITTTTSHSSISRPSSSTSYTHKHSPTPEARTKHSSSTTPKAKHSQLQSASSSTSSIPPTPELSSPGIIKTLKPATAPSKPIGTLKWAAAAAGSSTNDPVTASTPSSTTATKLSTVEPTFNGSHDSNGSNSNGIILNGHANNQFKEQVDSAILESTGTSQQPQQEVDQTDSQQIGEELSSSTPIPISPEDDPHFKFVEVLKNSSLSSIELELFSDLNLIKLPPGIQDLIISFTSTRKVGTIPDSQSKLLAKQTDYNHFKTSIQKPYLPESIQVSSSSTPSQSSDESIKPPLHLLKLQSSWNSIRASNRFDKFVEEIKLINSQNRPEDIAFVNELTLVLFYGLYYGLTPLENLIAETCLFILGWKPYGTKIALPGQNSSENYQSPTKLSAFEKSNDHPKHFFYWFKCIKNIPGPSFPVDSHENIEYGDYQVFDLFVWDIYVKYSFRFDIGLCQLRPSASIC